VIPSTARAAVERLAGSKVLKAELGDYEQAPDALSLMVDSLVRMVQAGTTRHGH
jgi:hypothetical protein